MKPLLARCVGTAVLLCLGCSQDTPVASRPQASEEAVVAKRDVVPTAQPAAMGPSACGSACEHSACAQTACSHGDPQAVQGAQPAPVAANASERVFGRPLSQPGQVLDAATVMAGPEPYLGKVIQCSGVVSRVCERAGCWLELRAEGSQSQGLRVPMAGHAFFIPQDAVGHQAVVEGELMARPLSDAERAHLEGEGLKAIGPLSLSATSVVIR